jgi:S1-C subfamily serine protease
MSERAVDLFGAKTIHEVERITNPTFERMARKLDKSVVIVHTGGGHGTGFLIDKEKGWFVTNFHVVDDLNNKIKVQNKAGRLMVAIPVIRNQYTDLAILKVDPKLVENMEEIPLTFDALPQRGQELYVVGSGGYNFFWGDSVTYERQYPFDFTLGSQDMDFISLHYRGFIISGHSGSPVIDDQGRLVAVNNMGIRGDETANFGIPVNYVIDLYRQALNGLTEADIEIMRYKDNGR